MGWEVCYFYPKNKSSKLKILITGASGFIGKNLISFLLNNNQITVIIRNKKKIIDQPWYKKVEIIQGDIFNKNLNIFYKDYDILIHLAWSNLNDYNHIDHYKNLKKHKKFIKNAVKNNIKRFIISGTCQEYGFRSGELSERMKAQPTTIYSKAKNELREYVSLLKKNNQIKIQWIRIFYLYGKFQNKKTLFGQLDQAIKNKNKIFNMSSGQQIRDYLSINELCKLINVLVNNPNLVGIVNCCSGKKLKLIQIIKKYLGRKKIFLNKGYYNIPSYEPLNFWGSRKKIDRIIKTF
jgi:dTDP-6-deoxy-L-talose 4-dehydrogenase (NAD+)